MEECESKIKDVFVSFFKECGPQTIDTLYKNHGPYSPKTSIACCYMKCIVAVSCWNEEAIKESYNYVKETHNMLLKLQLEHQMFGTPVEKLVLKVLTAEALLLTAVMKMAVKRCIKHYLKAGMNLRKSWKILAATQLKIVELCENAGINSTKLDDLIAEGCDEECHSTTKDTSLPYPAEDNFLQSFDLVEDFQSFFDNKDTCVPAVKDLKQLKVMSLFGYGLFHLILSLIPPTVLRVVNLLGFHGNRYLGLTSLRTVSRSSPNFRSTLASVTLLWYHLSLRPTFISNSQLLVSGINQGEKIIDQTLGPELRDTWITLYFSGTMTKLQGNVEGALELFQAAAVKAAHLRECKLMAYYEIGWCQLIIWNWTQASEIFLDLMAEARWSKGFYGYLAAISMGASGGTVAGCRAILAELPGRIKKTVNIELESFCSRKSEMLASSKNLEYECKLATLEIIYVWKCLTLSEAQAEELILAVDNRPQQLSPSCLAVSYLLAGLSWKTLHNPHKAEQAFKISDTITQPDQRDNYVTVCVLSEMAELYHQLGQAENSLLMAERARTGYKGYHLENRLYNRVHNLDIT